MCSAVCSHFTLTSSKHCNFFFMGSRVSWSCFLCCCAASSMGLILWPVCFSESLQTRHTGCWWSRQKSLSFFECRLQRAGEELWSLSCKKISHRFFNPRLGGSSFECLLLQSGHSFSSLSFHQLFTQSLQKLWLHDRTTGSLKTSWQTGQQRSSSNLEAIESPGEAEHRQSVSHSSTSFTEVHFLSESRC